MPQRDESVTYCQNLFLKIREDQGKKLPMSTASMSR